MRLLRLTRNILPNQPQRLAPLSGALASLLTISFLSLSSGWTDEPKLSGIDQGNFSATITPSEDFYQHVNGTWLEKTEIPADRSNYGSFSVLADDAEEVLRRLVEEAAESDDHPAGSDEQKVGDFYRSFMNTERLEELGAEPISGEWEAIAALATKNDLVDYMATASRKGFGNPFAHYVSQDAKQSDKYTVYLTQSGTSMPDRDYYLSDDDQFQQARTKFVQYVTQLLAAADYPEAEQAAKRILELETRFAEAQWTKVEVRDPVKGYNPMTRDELIETLSEFPLDRFFDAAGLQTQTTFVVRQPSFLEAVNEIFAETDLDVWKDFYAFRALDAAAPFLSEDFEQLQFDFYDRTLRGVPEQKPRWKRGIDASNAVLGELLGKLYVKERFTPEAKQRMVELVDNLKKAFEVRIKDLDWMSPGTKAQALQKLAKITTKIGYPDEWKDYSELEIDPQDLAGNMMRYAAFEYDDMISKLGEPVDRNEWHMTPQTVNAYYNPLMNEIVFPAAILQPPFFNLEADDAVNYGAIGAVIGHELSHGFDDKGSKYDGDGNLRNWWTLDDRTEFERRAQQLVEQYGDYSPIDGLYVNGELTLGENIGDLGGLNVAYTAYEISLGDDQPAVIDGMSGGQRFFYGWGQVWRRKYREAELRQRLLVDPHSPSRYRANGIVSNMEAFYKAFKVPEGSPMYLAPKSRVHIW